VDSPPSRAAAARLFDGSALLQAEEAEAL